MKRIALLLAVLAGIGLLVRSMPPRPELLSAPSGLLPGVRGAIHIHTRRSDGSGMPDQIAAAAARAGLQFVILTDHDTAASEPTRPYSRSGVLIIEGAEISTDQGHVVALGLPRAPYPLAGEARDVIEDIARLGGVSIAAHPGSQKPELRWVDWEAPVDGLEWLNGDSEWRDERLRGLIAPLLTYPFRSAETLVRLLDRPEAMLRKWDELTARRRVVAVAAADAHARIGLRSGEPDDPMLGVHLPSYEAIFRTFSITVSPVTLQGDAASDARAVIDAIRAGHVYSSVDALASPAVMTFSAVARRRQFVAGDAVPPGASELTLHVESNAPANAQIVLFRNGEQHATASGGRLQQTIDGARAVYRTEIHLPAAPGQPPVPWVVSNPIYVGIDEQPHRPPHRPLATKVAPQYENGPAPKDWMVVTSARSQGVLNVVPAAGGTQLSMRFGLGGAMSDSPYAALVAPAEELNRYDRVMFTAHSDRPLRLSVQLRVPSSGDGERWHRSVYLDENARDITVFFDDMNPRGPTSQPRPDLSRVHALMFVVDTVNTRPGTSGQIWIDDVKYGGR